MKLRCLIVDDEPLAREVLLSHVSKLSDLEVMASCSNAIQAFEILKKETVDLIFLDIQMPKLNGIDFLKILKPAPMVVFTTAYREFAVESYELNVLDYLVKPISFDRFLMAINKAMTMGKSPLFVSEVTKEPEESYIFLKADRKMVKIQLCEIVYIESLKDYVRVKLEDGKEVISLQNLSNLIQKLPENDFIRVHRSFIVAMTKITAFGSSRVEIQGKSIPVGRNYKEYVLRILGNGGVIN